MRWDRTELESELMEFQDGGNNDIYTNYGMALGPCTWTWTWTRQTLRFRDSCALLLYLPCLGLAEGWLAQTFESVLVLLWKGGWASNFFSAVAVLGFVPGVVGGGVEWDRGTALALVWITGSPHVL